MYFCFVYPPVLCNHYMLMHIISAIPCPCNIGRSGPEILELGSVLELADTLIEKVAPAINPVMMTLVSVAITEPFCAPSICW